MADTPEFTKDPVRQAELATVFDAVLTARVADTADFATAEADRDPSGGCIKVKSLLQTASREKPDLSASDLIAYVLDKARTLHAVFIRRLRDELNRVPKEGSGEPDFRPYLNAARQGDKAALTEIQRLMEIPVYEQVNGQSEMQALIAGVMAQVVKLDPVVNVFSDGMVEGSGELAKRMQAAIDATGKPVQDLMVVPKVNGPNAIYVPISKVAAGIEGGRNGCRFDAITEALS